MSTSTSAGKDSDLRNYPKNCWWVAGTSMEIGRKPVSRVLLELPVVLYRKETGEVVALDDRCPHRWAPLSDGALAGDDIVCPYHGAQFSGEGRCVKFRALGNSPIPNVMRVRTYPVIERGPFVWIWMGDTTAMAAAALPPAFEWFMSPEWGVLTDSLTLEANYMLLHENVLDLTHFNFVHAKSFEIEDWPVPKAEREGDRVLFKLHTRREDVEGQRRRFMALEDPSHATSIGVGAFETPAWHSFVFTAYDKDGNDTGHGYKINHLVTPAGPNRTYYWWLMGSNPRLPSIAETGFGHLVKTAFHEDKAIIESIQRIIEVDRRGRDYPELSIVADTAAILARRVVDGMLQKEQQPTATASLVDTPAELARASA